MPKTAKPDSHWNTIANNLAAGGAKPTVKGWQPGNGKWKTTIDNILKCPETARRQNSRQGRQSLLSFMQPTSTATSPCTCGWNHDNQTNAAAVAAAAAPPPARPQKEIDFGILRKPDPRENVGDVRGIYKCYKQANCFDLEVFGYADGKCPHCKSSNIEAGNLNKSVKLIFTTGKPRFVQGIGLRCTECNGKGWQSFEKTFVDTLPQWKQHSCTQLLWGNPTELIWI